MAPTKQSCELYIQEKTAIYKIRKKIADTKNKVASYGETKAKAKFGILNAIGADVIAAIDAVSSTVAEAALGAASQILSTAIEMVFSQLLKIILSVPTAIFSLVAIPHEEAIKAAESERRYLNGARNNLNTMISILSKWIKGFAGNEYYQQIKDAIPYLERAIGGIEQLINGLSGENAIFNESTLQTVHDNIQQAYKITMPYSIINEQLNLSNQIENNRQKTLQKEKDRIDAEYMVKMSELKKWYADNITPNNTSQDFISNVGSTINQEKIRNEYDSRMSRLQADWKEAIHIAELKSSTQVVIDKGNFSKIANGVKVEFAFDMQALAVAVSELYNNMKGAYTSYLECRSLCNTIYNIRNLIKNLISEMIAIMRATGNIAGKSMITPLETARAFLVVTRDSFASIEIPKDGKMKMASRLQIGHAAIGAADSLLYATITKSMVDMVNADDVLESGSKEFDNFIKLLQEIPDWDGRPGVWAVDIAGGSTPPYIQIVVDSFSLITRIFHDPESSLQKVDDISLRFKQLFNHNDLVNNTLRSYIPYKTTEAGDLMRILGNMGYLQSFAKTLSIASIFGSAISTIFVKPSGIIPTRRSCSTAYPELFKDPETNAAFAFDNVDLPSPHYRPSYNAELEKKRQDDMASNMKSKTYDLGASITQNDLISKRS